VAVEEIEARYLSTRDISVAEAAAAFGPFDLIFEATGYSPPVLEVPTPWRETAS
jgi:hypothetical protein